MKDRVLFDTGRNKHAKIQDRNNRVDAFILEPLA